MACSSALIPRWRTRKTNRQKGRKEKKKEEKRLAPKVLNLGRGPSGVGAPPWPEPKLNALFFCQLCKYEISALFSPGVQVRFSLSRADPLAPCEAGAPFTSRMTRTIAGTVVLALTCTVGAQHAGNLKVCARQPIIAVCQATLYAC